MRADLGGVQAWAEELRRGSRGGTAYQLVDKQVGGRAIGRNAIPSRAQVSTFDQAWTLLGVRADVEAFDRAHELTRERHPDLVTWVEEHPLKVLAAREIWPTVLAAVGWLRGAGGRGHYLREVTAPGVDTKFIAAHRALLAALLDEVLPAERIDDRHSRGQGFAERYRFAVPPRLLRVRCDEGWMGLPYGVSEVALRPAEAAALRVGVQRVVIVENEVTYLALDVPMEGVVVWGAGFSAGLLGRIPWIRGAGEVVYSGDIDTHGLAIVSMLRQMVPQTRSVLMDRETLLRHRDRWGPEPAPTRARLAHLTPAEQALYTDLVEDVYAPSLRLEQERLDWEWVSAAVGEW